MGGPVGLQDGGGDREGTIALIRQDLIQEYAEALICQLNAGELGEAAAREIVILARDQRDDRWRERRGRFRESFGRSAANRVGLDAAEEEKAKQVWKVTSPVVDELVRGETVRLIDMHLPPELAVAMQSVLDSDQWDDEQVRACVSQYRTAPARPPA